MMSWFVKSSCQMIVISLSSTSVATCYVLADRVFNIRSCIYDYIITGHLTFLLGTLYTIASCQLCPLIFLTNISKTWLTARTVDDFSSRYFWIGIFLHYTPSCLALLKVAILSLLWSHSPPITYTFLF